MLGPARLLTFAFRALVLLVGLSILWVSLAEPYNQALAWLAGGLLPADISARALGTHLLFEGPRFTNAVSVDGFTLHYGLILMAVLVLASVGVGFIPRIVWLLGLVAGTFAMHVVGVGLLGRGILWASGGASPDDSGQLVFSLFAVSWGLIPAVVGGLWCLMYWVPRVSSRTATQDRESHDRDAAPVARQGGPTVGEPPS